MGVRKVDSGGYWGRDGDGKRAVLGRRRDVQPSFNVFLINKPESH